MIRRYRTRRSKSERGYGAPGENFSTGTYEFGDTDLEREIALLATHLRITLLLYLMGHTQAAIGEHCGVSRPTVSKRLASARRLLREALCDS